MTARPYAVVQYRDAIEAHHAKRLGRDLPEGYFTTGARYGSLEKAQEQADYSNLFDRTQPSYVIDVRTSERMPPVPTCWTKNRTEKEDDDTT
jgi:hypothetical protein